jgi:hypothetical protein
MQYSLEYSSWGSSASFPSSVMMGCARGSVVRIGRGEIVREGGKKDGSRWLYHSLISSSGRVCGKFAVAFGGRDTGLRLAVNPTKGFQSAAVVGSSRESKVR